MNTIAIPRLEAGVYCELDLDARVPLTPVQQDDFRALYRAHHRLVLRNQQLTRDHQIRLMSLLGPVVMNDMQGHISNVRPDVVGNAELLWHADLLYCPEPQTGLSLFAVTADPGVATTRFANAERALERLPTKLRQRIENLHALHISAGSGGPARNKAATLSADWPQHIRPVVFTNPQTGVPILCATYSQTSHIVGISQAESDGVLDELFDYLYADDNVTEHEWHTGDFVIWDNFALQHARKNLTGPGRRDLERVIIGGRTVAEQFPEWTANQLHRMGMEALVEANRR